VSYYSKCFCSWAYATNLLSNSEFIEKVFIKKRTHAHTKNNLDTEDPEMF